MFSFSCFSVKNNINECCKSLVCVHMEIFKYIIVTSAKPFEMNIMNIIFKNISKVI
jgi:hypothetical protein